MLLISERESASLVSHELAYRAMLEALTAAVAPHTQTFPVLAAHGSAPENRFTIKSAATAELAGLKIGSYWPGNLARGEARHSSTIILIDQYSGRVAAVIEGGIVNAYRTAGADAVAAEVLARTDARALTVFGTGHQAVYECAALHRIRALTSTRIVARTPACGLAMIDALQKLGIHAELSDAERACATADIIVTATSAFEPLFRASWIRPGTHIASMGSDAVGKQELPVELLRSASLFCDLPSQSRRIGEFQHADSDVDIVAIGDVIARNRLGRCSHDEITIFDSSGLSVQDLVIAKYLLAARQA